VIYYFPVVGWFFAFVFAFLASIPFYYLWNWCAPIYFAFLPPVYLTVPFWHCVGLFMLSPLVKILIYPSAGGYSYTKQGGTKD